MIVLSGKLSRKIVGMLFVFFLVALSAIAMTLYLSWQLEGVAAAINDAGSQRMRTYRMAHLMSSSLENRQESAAFARRLQDELERFDQVLLDLRQGDPARPMAPPRDADVLQKLLAVEVSWRETVRPMVAEFLGTAPERREAVLIASTMSSRASSWVSTTSCWRWSTAMPQIQTSCARCRRRWFCWRHWGPPF
jgi:two-component system nitrate/nitrite sensor histidine kinase NarX